MPITGFRKGETVQATITVLERDQVTPIDLTVGGPVTFVVEDVTGAGSPRYEFNSAPQIVNTDAANGVVAIALQPSDIPNLEEGQTYRYDIWALDASGNTIWQTGGAFYLRDAAEKT